MGSDESLWDGGIGRKPKEVKREIVGTYVENLPLHEQSGTVS